MLGENTFQVSIKNKESETSKFFQFHSFLCCVICFELKIIVLPKKEGQNKSCGGHFQNFGAGNNRNRNLGT